MARGQSGTADSSVQDMESQETPNLLHSTKKLAKATPQRPPKTQGRRSAAITSSASRSRTQPRTDGGTKSRYGRLTAGIDPASPRGSHRGCGSSITSESVSGSFEELLLSTTEDSARSADNVKVVIRVRPPNEREEREAGNRQCVTVVSERTVVLSDPNRPEPFTNTFDHVLGKEANQEDVYTVAGEAVVNNCMAGFNSSIFAYGQTGAGKTYTMQGVLERGEDDQLSPQCGLILRVFRQLFQRIADEEQEHGLDKLRYSVKCSFLEIYNEVITDLLRPSSTGLNIRDGDIKKGIYVEELSETNVLNADDVVTLMLKGSANRHMAETMMNHESSRSHSVFTCTIEAHERTESGLTNIRYSKLNLIDLAGSERVGKSGATGERLTEAQNINKSLTTLGRVISALVERQKRPNTHVPYRDSRLTFLLQESLGGNSKTCIIANVSPSVESAQETHSTLLFAARAKTIKNKAVVNEDTQGDMRALQLENARLARLLEEAKQAQREAQEADVDERMAELQDRLQQSEEEVQELQARNAQLETVFDQSNQTISQLQAEHGAAKKELTDSRAATSRLTEDTVHLRSDNTSLSNELAQLRDTLDQERGEHEGVVGQLRQELESITAQLLDTEEALHAARRDAQDRAAQLAKERLGGEQLQKEVEQEREERRQAVLQVDELRDQLGRAERDAKEAQQRQEASKTRLKDQTKELFQALQQLRSEYEGLKVQLSEEVVRVAKYRRMASEIGNLVNAVQANSPRVGRPAGGRLSSPLGRQTTGGFGRSGRLPLGVTVPSHDAPAGGGAAPSPAALPLGDATNRRNSMTPVSVGSPASFRSPAPLSPSKHLVITNPAGRSPLPSPGLRA